MIEESFIRRLAFIKYLYKMAIEQSKKQEPLCSASILIFHDAVELFLQLSSEKLDFGKQQPNFMDYWDLFSSKIPIGGLTQKESMRRLNKSRVALKHNGTLPSKLDIETFRANVTSFFKENTPLVFGINFSDISMVELIKCEDVKNNLKETENLLQKNQIEESLDKVALAFNQLIDDFEERLLKKYGRNPFFFGESMTFLSSFHLGISRGGDSDFERKLAEYIDKVKGSIEAFQKAVKIISLGIDYRRYIKFRLLTPSISRTIDGNYVIQRFPWGSEGKPTSDDVQYCIDFVLEIAITLQEFYYLI